MSGITVIFVIHNICKDFKWVKTCPFEDFWTKFNLLSNQQLIYCQAFDYPISDKIKRAILQLKHPLDYSKFHLIKLDRWNNSLIENNRHPNIFIKWFYGIKFPGKYSKNIWKCSWIPGRMLKLICTLNLARPVPLKIQSLNHVRFKFYCLGNVFFLLAIWQ